MNTVIKNEIIEHSSDERLTATLKDMMEKGVEITPYMIVKSKIRLDITPSGKELTEMASYFSDCVDEYNRDKHES